MFDKFELLDEDFELVGEAMELTGKITKVDNDQQIVFGWVSIIEKDGKQVVDKQGDVIEESELEKMAHDFVLNCRKAGDMHTRVEGIGKLVESMVFTKEKQQALGIDLGMTGWWCGFHVDDASVWKKIKSGEYAAFSIHGMGRREKLEA